MPLGSSITVKRYRRSAILTCKNCSRIRLSTHLSASNRYMPGGKVNLESSNSPFKLFFNRRRADKAEITVELLAPPGDKTRSLILLYFNLFVNFVTQYKRYL